MKVGQNLRLHAVFVFEHMDEDEKTPRLWGVVSDLDLVAARRLDLDTPTAGHGGEAARQRCGGQLDLARPAA
jgi:hypothetical protein